jgi:hypothetical protein
MFSVRWLETEDYEILVEWWKDWRWTAPTRDMLPNEGHNGVIVSKDGVDICAGFLYETNSSFAMIEYISSNFEYKEKDRKEALVTLIEGLTEVARSNGYKNIFTSLKQPNLKRHFLKCGYMEGSTGTVELIKKL